MKLNQITLPMTDYAASVAFYRLLGLRLIVDAPPRYARFECPQVGDGEPATLSLEFVEGWSGGDWPLAYFEVDDPEAVAARLRATGVEVSEVRDESWLWREAGLRDPAGNRLKLYHAGANRRFPPWRVEG